MGESRFDDVLFDEGAGGNQSAGEVESRDDRFEGVGEKSRLSAAATLFFTAAETKQRAEVDASGNLTEMTAADEGGAEAREFAFARSWESAEERFGNGETENRVAYELQLFVV